jgi:hypothetical protein
MQVIPESPQKEKAQADDGRGSGVAVIALYFNDALLGHQKFPHGLSQQGFGFAVIAGLVLLSLSVRPTSLPLNPDLIPTCVEADSLGVSQIR